MAMKKLRLILLNLSLCLFVATAARAALVTGFIQCDSNLNATNDPGDPGVANVLVTITNFTHSFSNSAVTAADGSFSIFIPDFSTVLERIDPLAQIYVETIDSTTLPPGSSIVLPIPMTNTDPVADFPGYFIDFAADFTNIIYSSGTGTNSGNWLIHNPDCLPNSGNCGLNGNAVIGGHGRHADHSFGGHISPEEMADGSHHGHWTHLAITDKLLFQSTVIQNAICGPATSGPGQQIEFSGMGTLTNVGNGKKRKSDSSIVSFIAVVEDLGKQHDHAADRYYLRVFQSDGTTLLLVSGDPTNPEDIATVPVSAGNLTVTE